MSQTAAAEGRLIPEWTLGDRLRKARRSVKMTTAAFAEAINENPKTYGSWETDNSAPRNRDLLVMARRIEMLTRISAAWIIGLEPDDLREANPIPDRSAQENFHTVPGRKRFAVLPSGRHRPIAAHATGSVALLHAA